ncbi:MAG: NAD(P)H-quinone oxidoreductase [Phaeodactylibacter sp.]|uniref:NAD(P)H-quinone oxidoreductase n=1 Tax=Phaeodactylibacter sp. TaxID=1940289 RepID=UPI0032EC76B5
MKAIQIKAFGGPEELYLGDYETPTPADNEILVKVEATALNRADTLQRMGKYPPPEGDSPIMGLEMAGEVVEVGGQVIHWKVGDKVCGLLGGGGYAEYAVIPERLALPWPEGFDAVQAASVPEVFLTAFQALRWLAQLQEGERVLIHAGASGVGTAAIQLAKVMGAHPVVTASAGKHSLCKELGAELAIDYKTENFAERLKGYTKGKGVNVVIDFIGGPYLQQNLEVMGLEGRMVLLAFLGGVKVDSLNIAPVLRKRLQIIGSTLRARDLEYKIRLSSDLQLFAWPLFANGQLRPIVDKIYDWSEVAEAHRYMESNESKGKIVLRVGK